MDTPLELQQQYRLLFPHLTERQQHLVAAADAEHCGRGGITLVARVSGFSRPTISKAIRDLHADPLAPYRMRRAGAGRKKRSAPDPGLVQALEALTDPLTRGDPMPPLRWTCKSTRQLARALSESGHPVSHKVVAQLLHHLGYSLQAHAKTRDGAQHPDRNAQFRYLHRTTMHDTARGWPVISVDTQKKALVGSSANAGQAWLPQGQPERVKVHDIPSPQVGKAVPYGVYDVVQNLGRVNVGYSHDTASLVVESIRRCWQSMGAALYPTATRLLICAASGGSNGDRLRLWNVELQRWVDETGLAVTVCHFPPGTSKWNTIEHRLFGHITMNWRGRPLVSYQVIVKLIGATTTEPGWRVRAELDTRGYATTVTVTKEQMQTIHLYPHAFHGEWHYTLKHQTVQS